MISQILVLLLSLVYFASVDARRDPQPKLVVLLIVDGLRGDLLWQFSEASPSSGFGFMVNRGVVFRNSHYRHANTLTAVGHATIATGGQTAQHGIPGNSWHDAGSGKTVYCVEDPTSPVIGEVSTDTTGLSPRNLASSTIGDELALASGGRSRVFSVSFKDRGAILPGGHLGKAFWFSPRSGKFVSSKYYFDALPPWVDAWNGDGKVAAYKKQSWIPLQTNRGFAVHNEPKTGPAATAGPTLGPGLSAPEGSTERSDTAFHSALGFTPFADALTLDFAKTLLVSEDLGNGAAPDFLAISLSATDLIGHTFGPDSPEAADNMRRLDMELGNFLGFVQKRTGLADLLIVLTADHGSGVAPEHLAERGMPGGRFDVPELIDTMNASLRLAFDAERDLIAAYTHPSFYLDEQALSLAGILVSEAEDVLAVALESLPGVGFVATRTDLLQGNIMHGPPFAALQAAFHPQRSGHVLVLQRPYWYLNEHSHEVAVHGSPYSYDTHVPLIFAGGKIRHRVVDRPVSPMDIASTLALYLGVAFPSSSSGVPLEEVTAH